MTSIKSMILIAATIGVGGCATTVPQELASAREAYRRASTGPASQVAPAEVHKAGEALAQAEQSFASQPSSYLTRDSAYVAERKAQTAEALAAIATYQANQSKSESDFQSTQTQVMGDTKRALGDTKRALSDSKRDLNQSRSDLAESERAGQKTAADLEVEQRARIEADWKAADAQAALARLAAVKQETRGLVITLSGSVLFASDQSTLLPEAQTRLGEVSDALLATKERNLVVEGHTDSRGSGGHNLDLSQRRADAVRGYLVQKGYESDRVSARGIGMGRPIASNSSAEGRANNRRVEIIIEADPKK